MRCVCGFTHPLHEARVGADRGILCHSCGRRLYWDGDVAMARKSVPRPGEERSVHFVTDELEVVGTTII